MPDEPLLRDKARAAIRGGKVPARRPDRTWGGPGAGVACVICEVPIRRDELEFEIQFVIDAGGIRVHNFHVHTRCFAAWEFERVKTT